LGGGGGGYPSPQNAETSSAKNLAKRGKKQGKKISKAVFRETVRVGGKFLKVT
jgi:hypothetical protein